MFIEFDMQSLFAWGALIYVSGILAVSLFRALYPHLFPFPVKDLIGYSGGKWAVVTGSTDGIGQEYAKQLAQKGFNIVLVARNSEKLDKTAKDIVECCPECQVKQVVFDFTDCSVKAYHTLIKSHLEELDIGVLVNNVGVSVDSPDYFHLTSGGDEMVRDISVVNSLSPVMMSRLVLPQMIERNKGVIINVSSASAYIPMSLISVYSASKSFVYFLTRAIQREYNNTGLFIQTVSPFFVVSKMSKVRRPSFLIPTAENFVKSAIKTIGIEKNTNGYISHSLQAMIFDLLPTCLLSFVSFRVNDKLRKRAVYKKELQAKVDAKRAEESKEEETKKEM